MPQPQFTLRAMLVAILVVAAFFGRMVVQRRLDRPQADAVKVYPLIGPATLVTLPNGKKALQPRPIEMDEYEGTRSEIQQSQQEMQVTPESPETSEEERP